MNKGNRSGEIEHIRSLIENPELANVNCLIHQLELCIKNSIKEYIAVDEGSDWIVRNQYARRPKNAREPKDPKELPPSRTQLLEKTQRDFETRISN